MAKHEKKETITHTTYTCDVCGKNADGEWHLTEWTNSDITAEYWLPIDMCKKHAGLYQRMLFKSENPSQYMKERYDGFNEERKQNLITALKNFEESLG